MPRILGPIPADKSERRVYRQLEQQLPQDWVVLSNVTWSTRQTGATGQAWVRDGQADFVVIAPGFGLCVLEVKGSRYVRVGIDGRWYRSHDGREWIAITPKTPPEQAVSNAHEIVAAASRHLGEPRFPWPFGYVVVYPQGEIEEGGFKTFDPSTIVLRRQLPDLAKCIRRALTARGSTERRPPLNGDTASHIGEQLMNHPLVIGPADSSEDATEDRDAIERLTRQQHAALRGIFLHSSVAVTGPAGSGKTVLAVWRLRALVEQGERALLLCFNKTLALYLRMQNPDLAEQIWHVDSYFARLVRPQPSKPAHELDAYFSEELPGLVIDVVESRATGADALDALIVDEGQDFGEFRLWAARSLLRPGGSFLYCSDDRQDLYDRRVREAVGAEVVFSLLHNCRNTVRINDTGNRVLEEHIEPMPGLPEGVATTVEHVTDSRAMAKVAWRRAASWAGRGVRVAILSPYTLSKSSMASAQKGHNMTLVTNLADWGDDSVLFSTVKSFKGLEADAVVLVDVPEPSTPSFDRHDLYVATTRARARLAVLCSESATARMLAFPS